jgi:hypothetical protein
MKLEHAIEVLEKELAELQKPTEEDEDDIYDAVIGFRKEHDIKVALKILKESVENSKLINT